MKKYFQELMREHFSFSAKEKRGMLVLAGILFCLLAFRELYARYGTERTLTVKPDEWAAGVHYFESDSGNAPQKQHASFTGFSFDPNTISETDMLKLGLSPKQVASWIKYRQAGAVFRKAEDLKKLFFMDEERFELWEPWIQIETHPEHPEKPDRAHPKPARRELIILSLNNCDSLQLTQIRGIGAYTASKVLKYRSWLGGFVSHEQLKEIKGLRQEQIDTLIKYTRVDPASIQKIRINEATEEELKSHPYIRFKAGIIYRYRIQHGNFLKAEDLLATGVIDEPLLVKLKPYLDFEL
ncbi:MAG: helix-hairpin-helix domain-containing protein [Bacteroidia bacterium]